VLHTGDGPSATNSTGGRGPSMARATIGGMSAAMTSAKVYLDLLADAAL
jgi:hypothetical protein